MEMPMGLVVPNGAMDDMGEDGPNQHGPHQLVGGEGEQPPSW